jgi:hypothetical protein
LGIIKIVYDEETTVLAYHDDTMSKAWFVLWLLLFFSIPHLICSCYGAVSNFQFNTSAKSPTEIQIKVVHFVPEGMKFQEFLRLQQSKQILSIITDT